VSTTFFDSFDRNTEETVFVLKNIFNGIIKQTFGKTEILSIEHGN
jgi:hypothetical protein